MVNHDALDWSTHPACGVDVPWLLAYTLPHHESAFRTSIRRMVRCSVYYPEAQVLKRIRGKRKPVVLKRPAFPGYVFVDRFIEAGVVEKCEEFVRWICSGDAPVTVRDETVWVIQEAERAGKFDNLVTDSKTWIQPGMSVQITHGPMTGIVGVVIEKRHGTCVVDANGKVLVCPLLSLKRISVLSDVEGSRRRHS